MERFIGFYGCFWRCSSPEEEERMAGDAGIALVKAVGASQKAGAVAIEVNSKNDQRMINSSSQGIASSEVRKSPV